MPFLKIDTGDSLPGSCSSISFKSEGELVLNISIIPVVFYITKSMFKTFLNRHTHIGMGKLTFSLEVWNV